LSSIVIDRMDRKPLGKTGETTSAIGLGTWAIRDYLSALRVFVRAIEEGIDLIDTAEMYDAGRAEEFVGKVVREVGRDNVFITTKLLPSHALSPDRAVKAAKASLKRLGVREVDLVLLHWPDPSTPISLQVRSIEEVAREGLARYIGVSNFTMRELEEALWSLRSHEIVVNQVHYSLLERGVERDLLPYAQRVGITIQAYTPLERGRVLRVPLVRRLAEKYEKPPAAIALNYLISRPRVVAIVKTEKMDHLNEILQALGWRLNAEDLMELSRL